MIMEYLLDRLRDRLRVTAKSRRGECVPSALSTAGGSKGVAVEVANCVSLGLSFLVSRRMLA